MPQKAKAMLAFIVIVFSAFSGWVVGAAFANAYYEELRPTTCRDWAGRKCD